MTRCRCITAPSDYMQLTLRQTASILRRGDRDAISAAVFTPPGRRPSHLIRQRAVSQEDDLASIQWGSARSWICGGVTFQNRSNVLGRLDTLVFVSPDPEWQDFVHYCRSTFNGHQGPGIYYDVVHGPVSTVTNGFLSLRLEQLSFHSVRAINGLVLTGTRRGTPTL